MRPYFKRALTLILAGAVCLALLAGCGQNLSASDLVRNNLDLIYLDKYTEEYLQQVSLTEEEAEANYNEGIAVEVEYFATRFDIELDACDATIQPQLAEVLHQIYDHSRYEVGGSTKTDEGYEVEVTIYPIDILQKVMEEDVDDFVSEWQFRGENGEFTGMEEEEFETLWAQGIIDMVYARVDSIGYLAPQTVTVHVVKNEATERYTIDSDDFMSVDLLILAY